MPSLCQLFLVLGSPLSISIFFWAPDRFRFKPTEFLYMYPYQAPFDPLVDNTFPYLVEHTSSLALTFSPRPTWVVHRSPSSRGQLWVSPGDPVLSTSSFLSYTPSQYSRSLTQIPDVTTKLGTLRAQTGGNSSSTACRPRRTKTSWLTWSLPPRYA